MSSSFLCDKLPGIPEGMPGHYTGSVRRSITVASSMRRSLEEAEDPEKQA